MALVLTLKMNNGINFFRCIFVGFVGALFLFTGSKNFLRVRYPQRARSTIHPGPNPTIASYNASVVKFYNATGSLACFENKKYFILL
jgi:hypothetical protein